MKKHAVLLFVLSLIVSAVGLYAREEEPVDAEPAPKECYGYTKSIPAGGPFIVSFCGTGHGCKTEVKRAENALCKDKYGDLCAARTCPEGQCCTGISMGAAGTTTLDNCLEYEDPNGCGLQGSKLCVCNATVAIRVDCGCQCM